MKIQHLIDECSLSLKQLATVLEALDDTSYCKRLETTYDASIGLHVRHVIDHYDMFFKGLPDRLINYDARLREALIETSRDHALLRIRELIGQLETLSDEDGDLEVIMDLQHHEETQTRQRSSSARELAFLHSHSTHHYAALRMICNSMGRQLDIPGFGLAPATIRNQERLKCAP